jgi:hypothetical protein
MALHLPPPPTQEQNRFTVPRFEKDLEAGPSSALFRRSIRERADLDQPRALIHVDHTEAAIVQRADLVAGARCTLSRDARCSPAGVLSFDMSR